MSVALCQVVQQTGQMIYFPPGAARVRDTTHAKEGVCSVTCTQGPCGAGGGTVTWPHHSLYVSGAGWWHAVLNIPDAQEAMCVCCTQNALTPAMLASEPSQWAWRTIRSRWPHMAHHMVHHMEQQRPGSSAPLEPPSVEAAQTAHSRHAQIG